MTAATEGQPAISLRTNFVWSALGSGVYLASQWLLIMVLAKLGDPAMVGKFALASAIVTPIIIFSQMNLRHSLVTDINQDYHFLDCLYSRLIFTFVALLVIVLIVVISQDSTEMLIITGLMGLAKGIESISDIFHGRFQQAERMDFIAVSLILKGCINIIFFAALAWVFRDLFWPMVSMVVVWGLILLAYDIPRYLKLKNHDKYAWKFDVFKKLFWTTLPLSLNSLLASLSANMPRYFLEFYASKAAIGMFTVAAAPLHFISLLHASLIQTVMHRLAFYYQKDDKDSFKVLSLKTLLILLAIGGGFTTLFAFGGEELIRLLFSREYTSAAPILLIMAISATLSTIGTYLLFPVIVNRKFRTLAATSFISFIGQFFASIYLIKNYGVIGAGFADLIKTVVLIATCFIFSRKPSWQS